MTIIKLPFAHSQLEFLSFFYKLLFFARINALKHITYEIKREREERGDENAGKLF
jgi:hypothetical protein